MDRWNELIAGFVLGNLTPEEAESIARILAENPQLASHIARLRNTATVRSLGKAERLSARSQDGSEGWADTALDSALPYHLSNNPELNGLSIRDSRADVARLESRLADSLEKRFAKRNVPIYLDSEQQNSDFGAANDDMFDATVLKSDKSIITKEARKERRLSRSAVERFSLERFSLAEAVIVPMFNPLWWTAIAIAITVSIDNFRVRRSLQDIQEELTELKAAPQIAPVEKISPDRIFPNRTIAP